MQEQNYPKISASLVGYNSRDHLYDCLQGVLSQDYPNLDVVFIDNNSQDGSEEFVRQKFPQVRVVQTGRNTGYAGGHNIGIEETDGDFIWILTPDLRLKPDFLNNLYQAIVGDDKIAGVQGKLLHPIKDKGGENIIDSTGIFLNTSRRPFDRGQNEVDEGQYDEAGEVFGVNGAAPLYKRKALLDVAINGKILDEDIFMYWDDIDLAWRLRAKGWKLWYEPKALGFHGRAAGASPGGYKRIVSLVKHRKKLSLIAKKMSLKNNILVIAKNDMGWPFWKNLPIILLRQILIFGYSILIEPKTLSAIPKLIKQLPNAFKKRRIIAKTRKTSPRNVVKWFL